MPDPSPEPDAPLVTPERVHTILQLPPVPPDDPDPTLVWLTAAVSRRIEHLCGRRFHRHTVREHFIHHAGGERMLRAYPVLNIRHVLAGNQPALTLGCAVESLVATCHLTDTDLTLTRIDTLGVTHDDVLFLADHPTVDQLATAVNDLPAWHATAHGSVASLTLHPAAHRSVNGQDTVLRAATQALPADLVSPGSGIVYLGWPNDTSGRVMVVYDAGWDPIPDDVALLAAEMVIEAFHLSRQNPVAGFEKLGDYSRRLTESLPLTKAQWFRLRPYMTLAAGGLHR